MRFIDAITEIMESGEKPVTKAELARKRKVKPQSINTMFTAQKRVSLDVAAETAAVLDYRLVLMPCKGTRLPAGSYQIEG